MFGHEIKTRLFPLQAGLGYQLVQSLFIAKRQLIVEGLDRLLDTQSV
ncbi:MAG: hypothetical protein KatS3mg110_0871 [Pirellulaceae bacterium]|nr:MAG: hypothetical protein KatS3mg110_0871 [Pirellulaceae bacterium]